MIEINTAEDIKLIKEFAKTFSSDIDVEQVIDAFNQAQSIQELKESNEILSEEVKKLFESQKVLAQVLDKILVYLEKNTVKVSKEKSVSKQKTVEETPVKPKKRKVRNGDLPFEPYISERKEYQTILLEGINLVHIFVANEKNGTQKHVLPVNLFEFLVIAETFAKGDRSILNKEVSNLCELFGLTKPQFSKVYYNLMMGKFNHILSDIDKMINDSVFTVKKSHIYRNNHDTNLDPNEFHDLVNIYVNAGKTFLSIYKLIKEKNDIDSFDLLIVLKKSDHVANAIRKVDK